MTNNQTKWTPEEDQLLRDGVKKHGTCWEEVNKFMKNLRSINSIIKRWHSKIKYEKAMEDVRENLKRTSKLIPQKQPEDDQMSEEEDLAIKDKEEDLAIKDKEDHKYNKMWTEKDDKKLKLLVVESGVFDWETLANAVEADVLESQVRWRNVIYPTMIRGVPKSGMSSKWTLLEDKILNQGQKKKISWEKEGKIFLPSRSFGSIEARWRRIAKNFQVKVTIENKHLALKECLRRIAQKELLAQENILMIEEECEEKK